MSVNNCVLLYAVGLAIELRFCSGGYCPYNDLLWLIIHLTLKLWVISPSFIELVSLNVYEFLWNTNEDTL